MLVTMGIIDEKAANLANEIDDFFWRRRRDLNSRAGYPAYSLSRGDIKL